MSQTFETFGKYILLEKIATGGMAEVYLGKNQGANGIAKFLAIKRILPQFSENTEFIDMFKDEAKIAVNLSHSNIVSIYEFGVEKDQFFLVMDYVEGRNLRQILNKMKKSNVTFSIEQVLYIIKEVAAGLDHAHRCLDGTTGKPLNIIHRDMSPQNIMISFESEVKIVDFGIAKAETQLETTRAGTLKGKFGYMSPEQAEGQQVDLRTDIFSLGIVLWELLANDRLFVANNEINTLRKIRDCQVPSLRKINPNIPPELERIVSKSLAKDRNLRYQTAAAFHRELSRFLNRQYPDFSTHDFSVFTKTLFSNEILESRKKQIEYAKIEFRNEIPQPQSQPQPPPQPTAVAPEPQPELEPEPEPAPAADKTIVTQTGSRTEHTSESISNFDEFIHSTEDSLLRPMPPAKATAPTPVAAAATIAPSPAPDKASSNNKKDPPPQPQQHKQSQQPQQQQKPSASQAKNDKPQAVKSDPMKSARQIRESSDPYETAGLRVDRSPFRDTGHATTVREGSFSGSFHMNSYNTRSTSIPRRAGGTSVIFRVTLMIAMLSTLGGGALFYLNPEQAVTRISSILQDLGLYKLPTSHVGEPKQLDIASEPPTINVPILSVPPAAEILVDRKPSGELTPTSLALPEGKSVRITLRLAGYQSYEETFVVNGSRTINAALKADRKGYLDVAVTGAGQISINGQVIAMSGPANRVPVPADQEIVVSAFDPVTKASDETRVRVGENMVRRITLIPRAPAKSRPGPSSPPAPSQSAQSPSAPQFPSPQKQ